MCKDRRPETFADAPITDNERALRVKGVGMKRWCEDRIGIRRIIRLMGSAGLEIAQRYTKRHYVT
jgi:hypothetical protein